MITGEDKEDIKSRLHSGNICYCSV